MNNLKIVAVAITACLSAPALTRVPEASSGTDATWRRLATPDAGLMIVAHRGCHNPAPHHGLPAAPENSLTALDHCRRIGVEMVETDVRRTADGYLVIMHDDTVDRTTNGSGKVSEMTLQQLRKLLLKQNLGGPGAPITDQRVLSLDELLAAARNRVILHLDVKDASLPETVAAVLRAGAEKDVVLKSEVGIGSPAMAAAPLYAKVSFMPIIGNAAGNADLGAIAGRQLVAARPVAFELPHLSASQLPGVIAVARDARSRLLINTLGEGFLADAGDVDALRDPEAVWGALFRRGITIFQTDEPEALVAYRRSMTAAGTHP